MSMTCEFPCACPGRDTNVQCVCLFLMMETTANSALIKSRSSLSGLDLARSGNPSFSQEDGCAGQSRIKSRDADDAERAAGGVKCRVIRGPIAGLKNPLADGIRSEAGHRLWAAVPAKRARLNRARASRDPVIHGRRKCPNRFDYWIPALPRRAKPGSLGRNDRQRCLRRRRSQAASSNASNPLSSSIGRGGQPRMCRSTGITCSTPPTTA